MKVVRESNLLHGGFEEKDLGALRHYLRQVDRLIHVDYDLLFLQLCEIEDVVHEEHHQVSAVFGVVYVR